MYKQCPNCKATTAIDAKMCACGHVFRTQFVGQTPINQTQAIPMAPAKPSKAPMIILILFVVLSLGGTYGYIFLGKTIKASLSDRALCLTLQTRFELAEKLGDTIDPGSLKTDYTTKREPDGLFVIQGHTDRKNGFGVMLRHNQKAWFRYLPEEDGFKYIRFQEQDAITGRISDETMVDGIVLHADPSDKR